MICWLWIWVMNVAWGVCPATSSDVLDAVDSAESAYENADLDAFLAAMLSLDESLPCANHAVARSTAASVHRVQGLRALVERKSQRLSAAFGAARGLEPEYQFPNTLIPTGNPILNTYHESPLPLTEDQPAPAQGSLRFDGRSSLARPINVASIYQQMGKAGAVLNTAYLWPEDPVPPYLLAQPDPVEVVIPVLPPVVGGSKIKPLPLWITSAVFAVSSLSLLAAAISYRVTFDNPDTPYQQIEGLGEKINILVIASGVSGVMAGGFGIGAAANTTW